ncbi:hypothetical protein KAS08_02290 [Candidatus Pacearchaeota archaeon]|nr:hypothetical protein [Candidatus Pacearchaeota archaeon]
MNYEEHFIASAIAGFCRNASSQKQRNNIIDPKELLLSTGASILGGILPDKIEPATNPNHRNFAHSWMTFGLLSLGENILQKNENINPNFKNLLSDVSLGYKTHLLMDATTPKGLPFIGRIS